MADWVTPDDNDIIYVYMMQYDDTRYSHLSISPDYKTIMILYNGCSLVSSCYIFRFDVCRLDVETFL